MTHEETEEEIPEDLIFERFQEGDPSRYIYWSPSKQKHYYSYEA